ncbi:heme ABC transporter ATP-binding protein [Nocardioides sp. CBS4Y-1]|uniref:Heme ABC transporter ATP-binding protein n=1 Tax=Nocardioides acrostichi TaxID=2784339 RepID=A0A930UZG3_9ACTN|nr:heme ABC transporter ATP-binding protein [Nocardioides acrostichi]
MSVVGAGVRIDRIDILDDIDLHLAPAQLVALVGPNGAGKSTLLALLAGDQEPSSGRVLHAGRPVTAYGSRALARRRAVLTQHQGLAFGFTVRQVVTMGRAPWRASDVEDQRVVEESMRRADVDALAARAFPTLSGGERARASFARILAQTTPVILLDEPTAALDIRHQEAVLATARAEADAGALVVVVLHDLSLAAAYADRVCLVSGGRLVADGPPRQVLRADLLGDVYGHPVQVIDHDGSVVVLPDRRHAGRAPEQVVSCND